MSRSPRPLKRRSSHRQLLKSLAFVFLAFIFAAGLHPSMAPLEETNTPVGRALVGDLGAPATPLLAFGEKGHGSPTPITPTRASSSLDRDVAMAIVTLGIALTARTPL